MSEIQQQPSLPLVVLHAGTDNRLQKASESLRTLTACVLSMVLPGAGQFMLGHRKRGIAMIAVTALVVVTMIVAIPQDPFEALALAVQPNVLISVLIANFALLAFRVASVVDAYRLSQDTGESERNRASFVTALVLAVVLAVTAAPHAVVAWYDVTTYQTIDRVFNSQPAAQRSEQPTEVELTREINLQPGVTPNAKPVTEESSGESS